MALQPCAHCGAMTLNGYIASASKLVPCCETGTLERWMVRRFEGPFYADRVGGRLTFLDWDSWDPADQAIWQDERNRRLAKPLDASSERSG
jgi:hypothetical protein